MSSATFTEKKLRGPVGRDLEVIKRYIREQENEDQRLARAGR